MFLIVWFGLSFCGGLIFVNWLVLRLLGFDCCFVLLSVWWVVFYCGFVFIFWWWVVVFVLLVCLFALCCVWVDLVYLVWFDLCFCFLSLLVICDLSCRWCFLASVWLSCCLGCCDRLGWVVWLLVYVYCFCLRVCWVGGL